MAKNPVEDIDEERPTSVRYLMIALAMLVAVLLYLDRICLSSAAESVAADLDISRGKLDWLLSAFFWTYALGQLPAGWLGDRYGARWMLAAYVILWSLCTGLMGLATGVTAMLVLRLGCGLFEAGAYPVAASIIRRWVPITQRGTASSIVSVGGRLGGALAPILTVQLMLWWTLGDGWWTAAENAQAEVTSWRPVMILYGLAGIVIAFIFVLLFRDWPHEHPRVNAAEVDMIRGSDPKLTSRPRTGFPPLLPMIRSLPLWLNCFVQFVSNFGWVLLITKLPQYLKDVHGSSQSQQGWLQSLPLLAGIVGLLMGGVVTDFCRNRLGLRWGCSIAMAISRSIVAVAFVGCLLVDSPIEATLCLAVVGFATDLGTPACWAYGQDAGGGHVGSVLGWSNMWGNFGAAVSPVVFGWIVGASTQIDVGWRSAFLFCAVINVLAAVMALGIDASRPLHVLEAEAVETS